MSLVRLLPRAVQLAGPALILLALPASASAADFRYVLQRQTVTGPKDQAIVQYVDGLDNKNLLCVKTVNAVSGARTTVTGWTRTTYDPWSVTGAVTDYAGDDARSCYQIPHRFDSAYGSVTIVFTGTGGQQVTADLRGTEHWFFY